MKKQLVNYIAAFLVVAAVFLSFCKKKDKTTATPSGTSTTTTGGTTTGSTSGGTTTGSTTGYSTGGYGQRMQKERSR